MNGWQRLWIVVSVAWIALWVPFVPQWKSGEWYGPIFMFVPPALLYALGFGLAWVRRGFRK